MKIPTCLAFMALLCGSVWADSILVSDVTVEVPPTPHSLQQAPVHHTVTIRVRDDKARVESDDGTVVLYNFANGRADWLHPKTQTYTELPIGQLAAPVARDLGSRLGTAPRQESQVDVHVKPLIGTQDLAGLTAFHRGVRGSVSLTTVDNDRIGGAGVGFPGGSSVGGGEAGGGFNNTGVPAANTNLAGIPIGTDTNDAPPDPTDDPSADVDGEVWTVPASAWPDGRQVGVWPWLALTLPRNRLGVLLEQSLARQLDGLPLASRLTFHPHWTPRSPELARGEGDDVVVTTRLRSITPGTVPNTLLYPPTGYRQDNSILTP